MYMYITYILRKASSLETDRRTCNMNPCITPFSPVEVNKRQIKHLLGCCVPLTPG
jgi:hypothetical protein